MVDGCHQKEYSGLQFHFRPNLKLDKANMICFSVRCSFWSPFPMFGNMKGRLVVFKILWNQEASGTTFGNKKKKGVGSAS